MKTTIVPRRLQRLAVCCFFTAYLALILISEQLRREGYTLHFALRDIFAPCNGTVLTDHHSDSRTTSSRRIDALGVDANPLIEAVIVFTLVRYDLLDLHLASIDHPVKQLFVIHNYASEDVKISTLSIVDRYRHCGNYTNDINTCANANIVQLSFLACPQNLGFSGSVNLGIKAVMNYNLAYAFFSGDDTRFRPGRLPVAKRIVEDNPEVCIFHFEGYSSFVLTKQGIRRIGPFDENFWPAYAEDCDYWYRAQLASCKVFYRGGYKPDNQTPESASNAFLDHGDTRDKSVFSSATYRSYPELARLVQRTLDGTRGRFAYLARKWGFNTCEDYHEAINAWRKNDIIADPTPSATYQQMAKYVFPYNDPENFPDVRRWLSHDWKTPGAVSSRAVNVGDAPTSLVWQDSDFMILELSVTQEG